MALAQAEYFAGRCSIVAAVPEGPLRERFAACGAVIAPAPSLPTWDVSPGRWALQLLRSCADAFRLARTIRRRKVDAVLTSSTVLLAPVLAARLAGVPVVRPRPRVAHIALGQRLSSGCSATAPTSSWRYRPASRRASPGAAGRASSASPTG